MKLPSIAITLLLTFAATSASARPLEGTTWRTQSGNGTIRIETCGQRTCGRILTGVPSQRQSEFDTRNPNPAMRTRPLIGLNILSGFTRQADNSYKGGTIYNPEDGRTYRSEFRQKPDGRLEVKGCVGPFCQTQIWTPIR
jgi:uncharacterized protein (DUF2147 family)